MPFFDPQTRIYDTSCPLRIEDRAAQIRHLALIGLAANGTTFNIRNLEDARNTLFEVMHRLADELEDAIESLERRP